MNINTMRFKFVVFNVSLITILFFLVLGVATINFRSFIIEQKIESRKMVNDQAATAALGLVVGTGSAMEDFFQDFMSEYKDLEYIVAIGTSAKVDHYADSKAKMWFIKGESVARNFENLLNERPVKTEVFERGDILHIISPVYDFNNEEQKEIAGYLLSGFSLKSLSDQLRKIYIMVLIITLMVLIVGIALSYVMTSLFTKPLNGAIEVIDNVAQGDFTSTIAIKTKTEVGKLINTVNRMITTWKSSIEKLKGVIDHTNKSAENLSDAIKQQENITSEQASAVNEITTTVDELNSSSKQVYEKAEQVSQSSHDVLKIASDGEKAIKESIEEINIIRNKVKSISEHTLNLSIEAQQIGSIVKTVSDIANKTDMLAINAGIEAARAGEHGRGFSIVATEVRELADQSRKSAEKIAQLIENIQAATNTTVLATDEAINGFQVGIKLILEAGHTIDNLVKHVQETVNYASEIALASRQQSLGTEQVATVMSSINEAMRGTAQSASKILGEATVLKKLSDDLSSVANIYRI